MEGVIDPQGEEERQIGQRSTLVPRRRDSSR